MSSVVVTGGTARLGKAIAARLRKSGWRVLVTSHRAGSGADVIADLSSSDGADVAYAEVRRLLHGRHPDAWVNNASLYVGDADSVRNVGLVAPSRFIGLLAGRTGGVCSVVNILDAGNKGVPAYREAKEALRRLTKRAAKRYLGRLRVNAVSPGPISGLAPVAVSEKASDCPFGRPTVRSVVDAVEFLLENQTITGVDLFVDGGSRLVPLT